MPKKIALNTLNASTVDILNVIRQNASQAYRDSVPEITQAVDIPAVGAVLYGAPALQNEFINALVNRIALVRATSATFNNPYRDLKKGYLEYGEVVEEIFVNIARVHTYSADKAADREFKRNLPDVRSAFHSMNWKAMYPVTIQNDELRMAFLSESGVTDLIAKIVDTVYTAAEYDEFLLTKYMIIKAVAAGQMKPVSIGNGSNMSAAAVAFRGTSNKLTFMSSDYTEAGVKTTTPKDRQVIFMDANFNAQFDVEVLAAAFNMDKADFMGRLHLIDDFTTFDNERFDEIRAESTGLEAVTEDELDLMADVKAVLIDSDWFQIYDNLTQFTEKYVSSGLYWNYFYHTWKTISHSPYANAVVMVVSGSAALGTIATVEYEVDSIDKSDVATVITLKCNGAEDSNSDPVPAGQFEFEQNEDLTEAGIAVQKYGAIIIPATVAALAVDSDAVTLSVNGASWITDGVAAGESSIKLLSGLAIGDKLVFEPAT